MSLESIFIHHIHCNFRASARTQILNCDQSWSEAAGSIIPGQTCSKFTMPEPTSGCFGFGMAILCLRSARRSRVVKSMKVLLGSSVVGLGDGVGYSEIIIGLWGVFEVFGGVVSGEDGSWAMVTVVPRGSWIARGCGSED